MIKESHYFSKCLHCYLFHNRFYKKTGEIVAIKMIDLEAELLHDEQDTALSAICQEIQFMLECQNDSHITKFYESFI